MTLRDRLVLLLKRHGLSTTGPARTAIDDFLEVLHQEAGESALDEQDEASEDPEQATSMEYLDCPHCGERIGIALDLSGEDQDAIQDCEVCCSPIHVTYTVSRGRMSDFTARAD